jgi:predicted metal-dependent hydrolase
MTDCDFSDPRIDEGIRLFNAGDYFECHDVLEDLWSELTCPEKPFFQGLIQAAVALFHFEERNLAGACRMYLSARANLFGFPNTVGRINLEDFIQQLDHCFSELAQPHSTYPFHIHLKPERKPQISRSSP